MRAALLVMLAAASCAPSIEGVRPGGDEPRARPNIDAARELDQQGVRAFREGRYADALRYFRASYRLGGPPSELWNAARSRERLDDPEGAIEAIDEYLAQRGLSPEDRAEAEREQQALRARPSVLTVTSTPPGASVVIDAGQPLGATPLSVVVPPGAHTLVVRHDGYEAERRPLEARLGRAIIVSLDLVRVAVAAAAGK